MVDATFVFTRSKFVQIHNFVPTVFQIISVSIPLNTKGPTVSLPDPFPN